SWGEEIFERLKSIADLMDYDATDNKYRDCVEKEYQKLFDISLLPSEKINMEMTENNENFLEFGMRYANKLNPALVINPIRGRSC
ncbi:MAG: hypothetical protein K8E24_014265, partial [Methanobacterium paludis]|nr:hypothetical protein [Methanobacterium paludis]